LKRRLSAISFQLKSLAVKALRGSLFKITLATALLGSFFWRALAGVFRASTGLWEVGVSVFDSRILVAVAKLSGETGVGIVVALFAFSGTLGAIGIVFRNLGHGTPPDIQHTEAAELFAGTA
jgi:hypothetical protein